MRTVLAIILAGYADICQFQANVADAAFRKVRK